ncbi:LacI family DNA-binding transcriptional regulator [Algoriphagus halophytocola]|uniref:LacI family transcriptional regulator n=1 Tax=Algoriphagus halophytocola TaxID=2991499 RepID=A0ABY6MH92_9BACT|nr:MULTISPECIES: LacI family DNA-binding transcriptional regulator [unclassified Algoriphagus]UZD22849.1 LacI family transcriptional regulator [Algoriphagus sp. TR-M5]WBL44116.1 LacI family DNA-binding transcriptional regulator [Algoriphagus sp. TR-M9]
MKKKRISITDIANELSVTPSTVSRALNGGGKVSEKKRQEILSLAKKLGYRPNPIAKSLLENKTHTIGLIIPEFTHHFYSRMLAGIESVTSKAGYQLLICTSNEKQKQEIKSTQTLLDARVDGILATISKMNDKFQHLQEVMDSGTPLVLVDRFSEEIETPYVISDDFNGAFSAVDYLCQSGCKNILHIKGPANLSTTFNRFMGYKEALRKHEIEVKEELILESSDANLVEKIRFCLKNQQVDGAFAYSDYLAFEIYRAASDLKIPIPGSLSVIGYADEPLATYINPTLSTVNQQPFEMGATGANYLLNKINNPDIGLEIRSLETKLVIRDSCTKRAAKECQFS